MVTSSEESDHTYEKKNNDNESISISTVDHSDTEPELSVIFSDQNKPNEKQRLIVIKESQPLARHNVLYLGAAIPSVDFCGIDSVQEPLAKRYPSDTEDNVCGIEVWLSVDENGIQVQFISDPSKILYYPVRSLIYCGSLRYIKQAQITDEFANGRHFVALDTPEAEHNDNVQNPPLFAVVFQRTRYLPADECHCFVTKTKNAALELVEACFKAYQTTDPEQDCSKVPLYFKTDNDGSTIKEIDNEIYIAPASTKENVFNYQNSKDGSGFFYKTDKVPINCWQLKEPQKSGSHRTASVTSSSSHSSRRSSRHAIRTPVPNTQNQARVRSEFLSTNHLTQQTSQLQIDPYASTSNVLRVERIKDKNSGRDVYVRWINNMPPAVEQTSLPQKPNYDFYVDFNTDYPVERKLSKQMSRSSLNNQHFKGSITSDHRPPSTMIEYERKKPKKKHRKHKYQEYEIAEDYYVGPPKPRRSHKSHKHHHHRYSEAFNLPPAPFTTQEYSRSSFIQQDFPAHRYSRQHEYLAPTFSQKEFLTPRFIQPQDFSAPRFSRQQEYSTSIFSQEEFPTYRYSQQEYPAPTYFPEELPLPRFAQSEQYSTPTFPQQEYPARTYSQQPFPSPMFIQKEFLVPSFDRNTPVQAGTYTYHTLQPYTQSNNSNTTTPYWFFTM